MQTFKTFQLQSFLYFFILQCPFLSHNVFWYVINTLKKENDLWRNLKFSYIKRMIFIYQMLWFWRIKNTVSKIMRSSVSPFILMKHLFPTMSCSPLTEPALLCTHPQGWCILRMDYGLMIMVHRNIQDITIMIGSIQSCQCFECWEKSWLKCITLTKAYWLESVGIVTECISDHNDTNKDNNFLNLICILIDWLITLSN